MASSNDYRKAYETAKQELAELIAAEEKLQKKKISLRKMVETLGSLCENAGIEVDPSAEALYILEHSSLADDIRAVLKSQYPAWLRPNAVKGELEKLGRDLSEYGNVQATIHMVLKRMAESDEVQEQVMPDDGKKAYRCPSSPYQGQSRSEFRPSVTMTATKKK